MESKRVFFVAQLGFRYDEMSQDLFFTTPFASDISDSNAVWYKLYKFWVMWATLR